MSEQSTPTIIPAGRTPPPAVPAGGNDPRALLMDALALARRIRDTDGYGWWADTLTFLRIGDTLRLSGHKTEALAALRDSIDHNAHTSGRSELNSVTIEICRLLVLLGEIDQARALLGTPTFQGAHLAALHTIAATAQQQNAPAVATAFVRDALALAKNRKGEASQTEEIWIRAFVGLAARMNDLGLARELIGVATSEFWRSAALGDVSEVLVRQGGIEEAIATARGCPDRYMGVLACARVSAALAQEGRPEAAVAVKALLQCASEVKERHARAFALRIAVQKLAAVGATAEAARAAAKIEDACLSVLARCELVSPAAFGELIAAIGRCSAAEQPLLMEALAAACGAKAMGAEAAKAAEGAAPGWPRVRALCEAALRLIDQGSPGEAACLLDRAAHVARDIEDPGWRAFAHMQLAIRDHRAGRAGLVDAHLKAADATLAAMSDPAARGSLLPQLVEAALAVDRRPFARAAIAKSLRPDAGDALRDRLVPLLVLAGDSDAALAECARRPLQHWIARRLVAYRLAVAGEVPRAVEYTASLEGKERSEALADIARAQLRSVQAAPGESPVVGVSQHGSWRSWLPRLERLGHAWELVPFLAPYELGGEGLGARYSMLCYPGTGSHEYHVSAAGIESLREYLYAGGGLFGICAGQFLATRGFFVPTREVYHPRGQGPHQVQIVKQHPVSLTMPPVLVINRMNGGFMAPAPGCDVVGWYDTIGRYAALAAASYGLGRVVAFSPHPEGSSDFVPRDRLCINAMYWITGGTP